MNALFVLAMGCLSVSLVSAGAAGKTTRYWDCCKPSCSWSEKAAVSAPVQVCDKDGVKSVPADTTNVCGGGGLPGKSYMCNGQQPVAVNSSLSLGFAAAHLAGQAEKDWCCACYELTFTSTAVSGKKLVVQITNTGGELGNNHFDLQMPGGGVGVFGKGCQDQWGTSEDGWGSRYGGVSGDGQCSQLPSQLQAGCHWRFGWFANADNPSITLERVQCPKSLVDKTKCTRTDDKSVANAQYANL